MANSEDPDQTAPLGAVWSWSTLFAQAIQYWAGPFWAMVKGIGSYKFDELMNWLMETLKSEGSSVDRSGSAQGTVKIRKIQTRNIAWGKHSRWTKVFDTLWRHRLSQYISRIFVKILTMKVTIMQISPNWFLQ